MTRPASATARSQQLDPRDSLSLRSIVDLVSRRKYALALPFLFCVIVAAFLAYSEEDTYSAHVLMMLESPRSNGMLDPRATVRANLAGIRETVNRRSLLETVINEFEVYGSSHGTATEGELDEMRERIRLSVEGDQTFHVFFTDADPERATQVVNRIGELLVAETESVRISRARALVDLISSEVEVAEQDLLAAQEALEDQRQRSDEPMSGDLEMYIGSLSVTYDRLQQTNRSIANAEARKATTEAEMRQYEQLRTQPSSASSPIVIDPQRAQLQQQLDRELERGRTAEHPTVARLLSQIEALDSGLDVGGSDISPGSTAGDFQVRYIQLRATLSGIESELEFLQTEKRDLIEAIAQYHARADADSQHEEAMDTLLRNHDLVRTRYLDLMDRLEDAKFQANLEGAGAVSGMRVAEQARVPDGPSGPQRLRIVGLGALLGIALGIGAVLARHQLDTSVTDVAELAGLSSLPTIASIPSIPGAVFSRKAARLPTLTARNSIASEQYRILASRLRHEMDRECAQVLLVTSGAGGEGKTTTAVNLAIALSQIQDERVLLLDADLRRPRVRKYLSEAHAVNLGSEGGLLDLVSGSPDPAPEFFGKVERLQVLAGSSHSSDSLSAIVSNSAQVVLARLRKRFKYIIVDAPPILPMVDSHILSELADKVVLVVRARYTRRETLERTLINFDVARVLGLVLNDVDFKSARYAAAYTRYAKNYLPKERWSARIRVL